MNRERRQRGVGVRATRASEERTSLWGRDVGLGRAGRTGTEPADRLAVGRGVSRPVPLGSPWARVVTPLVSWSAWRCRGCAVPPASPDSLRSLCCGRSADFLQGLPLSTRVASTDSQNYLRTDEILTDNLDNETT